MSVAAQPLDQPAVIRFDEGIIGVPRARRFELLERPDSPIRLLRCLDVPGLCLPVVDPHLADPDYRPALGARVAGALEAAGEDPMLLLAVAKLEDDGGALANLRAPLVINVARRTGLQIILDDRSLSLRAPVRMGG